MFDYFLFDPLDDVFNFVECVLSISPAYPIPLPSFPHPYSETLDFQNDGKDGRLIKFSNNNLLALTSRLFITCKNAYY